MKSHTRDLAFHTREQMEFVNITSQVEAKARASDVNKGLCLVNAVHITASVFINDDDMRITNAGRSGSRRTIRRRSAITTTAPEGQR